MRKRSVLTAVSILSLLFGSQAALAGRADSISNTSQNGLSQELRDRARGYENPRPSPDTSSAAAEGSNSSLVPGFKSGAIDGTRSAESKSQSTTSRAYGSFGIPFTSTRVALVNRKTRVKSNSPAFLSASYPYSAIGRLTFNRGADSYVCSASLIRRSVIVTAAHCLMDVGSNGGWFTNWQFTPGYFRASPASKPVQPFGVWLWAQADVPPTWSSGSDSGSEDARNNDVAVIILDVDRRGKFIGDTTGWLGYGFNNYSFVSSPKTGNLAVAQVSTLGYPCELDNCSIMQRTDGPTYQTTVDSALQYWQGSNMTGGSSGGPWIVNFKSQEPVYYDGASPGDEATPRVIGVTSWGSADPNFPKDNYSSRFGQNAEYPNADYGGYGPGNIGYLLEKACTTPYWRKPNYTYAQLGFCN